MTPQEELPVVTQKLENLMVELDALVTQLQEVADTLGLLVLSMRRLLAKPE